MNENTESRAGFAQAIVAREPDQGAVDSGRRPKRLRGERSQHLDARQKLHHHAQRPVTLRCRARHATEWRLLSAR